jgi:hypothetical protein
MGNEFMILDGIKWPKDETMPISNVLQMSGSGGHGCTVMPLLEENSLTTGTKVFILAQHASSPDTVVPTFFAVCRASRVANENESVPKNSIFKALFSLTLAEQVCLFRKLVF